jgi:hypothetical protein
MLNKDINSRFEDWLLNPAEGLDFEVKGWLDLSDAEARGTIAKALIALENHGGGFLLIGFMENDEKRLVPEGPRPTSLEQYGSDEINAIIKKCAEPTFHADVTFQKHPETGEEFPLVRVRGTSRVPVRSCSATPGNALRLNVYYIRRPGPASESPMHGVEWESLIRRCVLNQRAEIVDILRSFLPSTAGGDVQALMDERHVLNTFCNNSYARWKIINEALSDTHPSKITLGTFAFSCQIIGNSKNLLPAEILAATERLKKYTGWPILLVLHQKGVSPYLADGCVEASLVNLEYPSQAHADYWRVHPDGLIYLLRGYQEDSLDVLAGTSQSRKPGTGFEFTLPVWRVGEFLLRVEELGRAMYEDEFSLLVRCEWTGLKGRELFVFNNRRILFERHICQEDVVVTEDKIPQAAVTDLLPDAVSRLTSPLYQHFDFFQPPDQFYVEELESMKSGKMV